MVSGMKKMIFSGGVFVAGTLLHLICCLVFLFSGTPMVKASVLVCLLVLTALGLISLEQFMAHSSGELDERLGGALYHGSRLAGAILGIETLNTAVFAVRVVFDIPGWLNGILLCGLIVLCVISVLACYKLMQASEAEREEVTEE